MPVVSWTPEALDPLIIEAVQPLMDDVGQQIADTAAPPIDTGFLNASAYVESPGISTYGNTWTTGSYPDRQGQMVPRFQTPVVSPSGEPPHGIVGWAAEHALIIEETQPFIYIALMSVVDGGFGGTFEGEGGGDDGGSVRVGTLSVGETAQDAAERETSDGGLFSLSWM